MTTRTDQPATAIRREVVRHRRLGPGQALRLGLFVLVLLAAFAHGMFYRKAIPPWDVIDEEQHLAYALTLRDEQRIPRVDEFLREDIIASAVATDRWGAFHMGGRPERTDPLGLGLEGRSYEAYQPPLYYLLLVPVTALSPHDPLMALYLARATGALLLAALAASAWGLAAAWFPRRGPLVPASAALCAGSIPSAAAAAGRVNNDLMAAVLISAGLLAIVWMLQCPTHRRSLLVGVLAAAAALTKAHGRLLLPLIAVSLLMLWRGGRFTWRSAAAALAPGVAASAIWSAWTYRTYGVFEGTSAFLKLVRPFDPLPPSRFVSLVTFNMWESYLGQTLGPWEKYGGSLGLAIVLAIGAIGVLRRPRPGTALALVGLLGAGLLAVLVIGNATGLVPPQGRLVIPIFPALAALVAGGWSRWLGDRAALIPAAVGWTAALLYAVFWFWPYY